MRSVFSCTLRIMYYALSACRLGGTETVRPNTNEPMNYSEFKK